MTHRNAFTLIELLVVVGVLAILAAIALPNFLEAQTRSKVSRVLADLTSLRTAVEAYAVDWNSYPRMAWGRPPFNDTYTGYDRLNEPIYGTLGPWITTPTSYISQFDMLDPFTRGKDIRFDAILYTYHDLKTARFLQDNFGEYGASDVAWVENSYGSYFFLSLGPDGDNNGSDFWTPYDPTNGTISEGNIIRSQKNWEKAPPRF
jgi:prepilin-type N-terminal cleavage/methylation domain-containing protein